MAKDEDLPIDQLFRTLSAKDGRPKFAAGGRELTTGRQRMGEGHALGHILRRVKAEAAARKAKTP